MRRTSLSIILIVIVFFMGFFTSAKAFAGKHWLGGSRTISEIPHVEVHDLSPISTSSSRIVGSTRVFDIVISLHNNPSTQAERTPYEEIMGYFADAVYEATEGAHKIGKVSIYRNSDFDEKVDISWTDKGRPKSIAGGNEGTGKIMMYDIFEDFCKNTGCQCSGGCDSNFLASDDTKKNGGYTLGHEWGHYAYYLYDEYPGDDCSKLSGDEKIKCENNEKDPSQPHFKDDPVNPSIMNYQFAAVTNSWYCKYLNTIGSKYGCGFEWLNFSIAYKSGMDLFRPFQNTRNTSQNRMWESSVWETLVRDPKNDPKGTEISTRPKREIDKTYFPELSNIAPQDEPRIDLPDSAARSELNIVWMTDKLVYQIIIDKSGSMGGASGYDPNKILNSKAAAKYLVDVAEIGKTAIGVIAFNDNIMIAKPITEINNNTDKDDIKRAIDGIDSSGSTALYDAAMTALNALLAQSVASGRAVFLLTDGMDNASSTDASTVITNYRTNNIPLFTFAYGNDADKETLQKMASSTRGKFYYSPTTLSEITLAFNDAIKEVTPSSAIKLLSTTLSSFSAQAYDFPVDSTLNQLKVSIIHNGSIGDIDVNLKAPDGTEHSVTDCSQSATGTICLYSQDAPKTGIWQITNKSQTVSSLDINCSIDAIKKDTITYSLSAFNISGDTIHYPTPIVLLAAFNKNLPIAGAVVSGTIELPNGTIQQLTFRDDGIAPDYQSNDGKYSAIFENYTMNGVYGIKVSANNNDNSAYMTHNGLQPSAGEDGTILPIPPDIPVGESVERNYSFQLSIWGVVTDDHGNDFSSATQITADNSDTPGKIEYVGDVDFFRVYLTDSSLSEITFRATHLSPHMVPVLSVYDEAGTLLQEKAYNQDGNYVSIQFNPTGKNVFYVQVRHIDENSTGTYYVSAGGSIGSDFTKNIFSSCSLINTHQPLFNWNLSGTFTNFKIFFSLSPTDYTKTVAKATVKATHNYWTPSIGLWKKIINSSYNKGNIRDIYWKVVGTKSDKTAVESSIDSFRVETPLAVSINAPHNGDIFFPAVLPTFNFNSNCNVKFRLVFSSLSDFSQPSKLKKLVFNISNPNSETVIQKTLTTGQWASIKGLVGDVGGETIYWYAESWDALKRYSRTGVMSFVLSNGTISDNIPPSVPTGLTATAVSSSQINLSWNASSDNIGVAGYKVYDSTGVILRTVTTTSTSFSELLPTSTYCFTVSAIDAANNESVKNIQACATTFSGVSNAPDLLITSLTAPTTGTIGSQINMSVDIVNQGSVNAGPFHVAFYYSSDSYIDMNDTYSGWMCDIPGLNAGSTWNCSGSIGIPSTLTPGLYYLGAIADDLFQISESDENNNIKAADTGPITLTTGSPPGTIDVTGCWTLSMTDGVESNTFYLDLVQSGNTFSGKMILTTDQSVQLSLAGSINGSTITFVAAQAISLTGIVNGNTISGSWANPYLQKSGTWNASRTCSELFIYASSGYNFDSGPSYLYKILPTPNGTDQKIGLITTDQLLNLMV